MTDTARCIVVCGAFDNLRSPDIRFLQEAARLGPLHVLLFSDTLCQALTDAAPKFPQAERLYYLQAVRYVEKVHLIEGPADSYQLPTVPGVQPRAWVVRQTDDDPDRRDYRRGFRVSRTVYQHET